MKDPKQIVVALLLLACLAAGGIVALKRGQDGAEPKGGGRFVVNQDDPFTYCLVASVEIRSGAAAFSR